MKTLADVFHRAVGSGRPDLCLQRVDGNWTAVSAQDFGERTRALSLALARAGVSRGDRVAILCDNRPEWAIADFAVVCRGAVTVPVYTTYLAPQVEELLKDSGARVAFAGTATDLAKILEGRARCPELKLAVLVDGAPPRREGVASFDSLLRSGREILARDPAEFDRAASEVRPEDLATLIYTSGTTGRPKGAMLTHGNFVADVEACMEYLPVSPADVALSFLPLAHVFERNLDYAYYSSACCVAYVDSVDRIGEALQEVRPSVFGAVPRVYEKVRERVLQNVESSSGLKKRLFARALEVGASVVGRLESGRPLPPRLALQRAIFDRLVFSKIRKRLGGRFRFSVSGGAPLGRSTAEFFWSAGIHVFEGYGLTETSPVIAVNHLEKWRLGSVGPVLRGVDVKIALDGEILVRGPIVMKGYWNKPEETAAAFTPDGWLRTGDIGRIEDGFLFITDRKKEMLVNAYGKNVAPAPIEAALASMRYAASAVLIGDRQKFISALIVPRFDRLEAWARDNGVDAGSRARLVADPRVQALFQREIDALNAGQPHENQVRKFTLLPGEFSLEGGELTPTLKIKRRVVAEKYAGAIRAMYGGPGER